MNKGVCKCDKCQREIHINPQVKKNDDLEITYFECPGCHEEYVIIVTDSMLRKMIHNTEEARLKAMRNNFNKPRFEKHMKIYKTLLAESEQYKAQAKLKERYLDLRRC